jgi:tetratricopeptide (TPR) repeat protein
MFSGMKDSMADEVRADRTNDRLAGLIDSAQAHLLADRADKARAVWERMIEAGGEEGDWGHFEYAAYFQRTGQEQEANEHFLELMLGQRVEGEVWRRTAVLLEERGDLESALLWYSWSASHHHRFGSGESAAVQHVRAARRRLRWTMRIPLDEIDLEAEIGAAELKDKWFDLLGMMGEPVVVEGRLQFWNRDDIEYAMALWPGTIAASNPDEYYQKIESVLRAHGGDQVVVVPRGVHTWMASVEATNNVGRLRELRPFASKLDDGRTDEWPPKFDQQCWCGSGTQYADCCGATGVLVGAMSG